MKQHLFSAFILIFLCKSINAQQTDWGSGFDITSNINNKQIDISVFDTDLQKKQDTSLTVGTNPVYSYSDGVIVCYGGDGYMVYATYDLELHHWKAGQKFVGSNETVKTNGTTVIGYDTLGKIHYCLYDPHLSAWVADSQQLGTHPKLVTENTLIAGCGDDEILQLSAYNFDKGEWVNQRRKIGAKPNFKMADGVIAAFGADGALWSASFELSSYTWVIDSQYIGSNCKYESSNGVIACYDDSSMLIFGIYDFNQKIWAYNQIKVGQKATFAIDAGSITFKGDSSGTLGYSIGMKSWGLIPTKALCKFLPLIRSNDPWVYMQGMYMGASSVSYNCGDGHEIKRRQGWKKYYANNLYMAEVFVSNKNFNSSCSKDINIDLGLSQEGSPKIQLFPNPSKGIVFLQLAGNESVVVTVTNMLGQTIFETMISETNSLQIPLNKNGIYCIRVLVNGKVYCGKIVNQLE